jgi:CBS domain-containing protein
MSVEEVMEPGPSTVRPDGLLEPLVGRMTKRGTHLALVTTPQGELIGALIREEAQRLLRGEPPEQIWRNCDGCPGRWAIKAKPA